MDFTSLKKILDSHDNCAYREIKAEDLVFSAFFRDLCIRNSCGNYNTNYMCSSFIGEAQACIEKAKSGQGGLLYQAVYPLEDSLDLEGMRDAKKSFTALNIDIQRSLQESGNGILHLGAGACKICERCAIRDNQPCRNPGLAIPPMEGYCIDVAKTAGNAGLKYINGENTVTYFGLVLFGCNNKVTAPESGNIKVECDGYMPAYEFNPVSSGYGMAVDIGTTTIAARIVNLDSGEILKAVSAVNPQRAYGADVMSRIDAALAGKLELLQNSVNETIKGLTDRAAADAGVNPKELSVKIYTGNTTQLYLCTGRNPGSLAKAPFEADCLFGFTEQGITYPPCFGAFVGADIYTAVLASGMLGKEETALLVDLGTNGEIVLFHEGRMYCCATACGPAFESSTVLFGSELIDLTAELLEKELISPSGKMDKPYKIRDNEYVYPEDIRSIQLAKAAICAGIITLLKVSGVDIKDIKALYLAGGFGKYLNCESAARIGLFPKELKDKVKVLGNAALSGAVLMLLDADKDRRDILQSAECINLANQRIFSDNYIEQMMFGEDE